MVGNRRRHVRLAHALNCNGTSLDEIQREIALQTWPTQMIRTRRVLAMLVPAA